MKFYFDIFIIGAFSAFLFFLPVIKWLAQGPPQTPWGNIVLSLATLIGVIGGFSVSALMSLNRRLKVLEKSAYSSKQTV